MNIINCTPHEIRLNSGAAFSPSGNIARVSTIFGEIKDGVCAQSFGEIIGLPVGGSDDCFIVSALVLAANKASTDPRSDLIAPATGHPETKRNDKGHIVSVPCFVK